MIEEIMEKHPIQLLQVRHKQSCWIAFRMICCQVRGGKSGGGSETVTVTTRPTVRKCRADGSEDSHHWRKPLSQEANGWCWSHPRRWTQHRPQYWTVQTSRILTSHMRRWRWRVPYLTQRATGQLRRTDGMMILPKKMKGCQKQMWGSSMVRKSLRRKLARCGHSERGFCKFR